MYKTWSNCISATVLVLAENELIQKFIQGLIVFGINWKVFWIFIKMNSCIKKKVCKMIFCQRRKVLNIFQNKSEKAQKVIWFVLDDSKTKILSVGQSWWPTFFQDFGSPNYFSAAAALSNDARFMRNLSKKAWIIRRKSYSCED